MKNPPQTAVYQQKAKRVYLKGVTSECFNRGSVPDSPGFPIEAFGNDELLED